MNHATFLKIPALAEKLLYKLGVIDNARQVIEIDNSPDYDITKYQGDVIENYFFRNSWYFSENFSSVISVDIIDKYIFHADNLRELSAECKIPFTSTKNACDFLLQAQTYHSDIFESHSHDVENDEFKLHELRISSIDNFAHEIRYEGSFRGNSADIQPIDWGIYATLEIKAISNQVVNGVFYKSLLAESYLLLKERQFKLSYFLTFAAFDSFIIYQLGRDEEGRLEDKLKEIFRNKFAQINTHQIYTSLMGKFKEYVIKRNNIAHGTSSIVVSEADANELLVFAATLIQSFENNVIEFVDLAII
jgi:hypothetical protein